jgi:hypothetical protein
MKKLEIIKGPIPLVLVRVGTGDSIVFSRNDLDGIFGNQYSLLEVLVVVTTFNGI